ncbi:MAG: biosynthetic-type acetolactate synthase large subunit [Bacteroidales bacterium]|nr:biosynthetic-type acetolactate synthase large subunit [Bacteroidales bacterium]
MTTESKQHDHINGAEALLRTLLAEGVDTVFGYPGGAILPVYDALYDYADRLRHILVRHEQGAMHAAQGYARATGRTGVVIVTSGPGAANCVTGLSDAMMDSTPLVVITGQVGARYLGSDAFQETDVVAVTQPITKWSYQVRSADEVPEAVAKAFYIASTGRPGPVVLDIAKDAQIGMLDYDYRPVNFIRSYNPEPVIDHDAFVRAAGLINEARRPLILAGQGVTLSGAGRQLAELAERASIPVGCTLLGLSAIPTDHPLYAGMAGMHGAVAVNHATNRADLIIALGMRFDDRVTGNTDSYAPQARVIHVDIDSSEFGKTVACDVALHGDVATVLDGLLPMISPARHDEWLALLADCAATERAEVVERELHRRPGSPMTMGEVARAVGEAAGPGTIAVTDVGQNQMMTARYFPLTEPRSFISSGGLGTMGFGLPAAIGAAVGRPDRTVCYFGGDGGLQMTVQELGTIMQYGIPVKMILLNNNFLGNVRQWQNMFFGARFSQTPLLNPDFKAIAAAYGIAAEDVARREDLPAAIGRMLAHDGAYLLNVAIDETDMVFPMTPPGHPVDYIMLTPDKIFSHD